LIYMYALTDRPGAALPDPSLRELAAHGVAAVFTPGDRELEPTPEVLWAHEKIVERLMRDRTVVPLRFGTTLADEDAVHDLLKTRGIQFARILDRVRGHVELSVRVAGREAVPEDEPASGTEYMRHRLGARRDAERVASAVHAPLARMADGSTRDPHPRGGFLMAGSYLLPEDRVDRFVDQVHELQRTHRELALTCTGPWPPYSFVEEEDRP
jgi:Gas vesicle synthesis protein GvpL/GvpF